MTYHSRIVGGTFVLLALLLTACAQSVDECPITVDTVQLLDSQTSSLNGKTYLLYQRISGWHDKVVVLQLFDATPVFDACHQTTTAPLFETVVEDNQSANLLVVDTQQQTVHLTTSDADNAAVGTTVLQLQ